MYRKIAILFLSLAIFTVGKAQDDKKNGTQHCACFGLQ